MIQKTLQILGVSLTGFTAARSSYDLNFYQEQTTPILVGAMDRGRNRVLNVILQKKKQPILQYSLYAAINDIVDYYNAGTIIRAFVELNRDTAIGARTAEFKVLELQEVDAPFAQPPSDETFQRETNAYKILDAMRIALANEETKEKAEQDIKVLIETLEANNKIKQEWDKISGFPNNLDKIWEFRKFLLVGNDAFKIEENADLLKEVDNTILRLLPQIPSTLRIYRIKFSHHVHFDCM